jgi:ABC-type amino acid transport system permease subunit
VGMMSEHNTPYASIETAVEVARSFAHVQFGTRRPRTPLLLTHIIFLILIVLVSVLMSRAR